FGFLHSPPTAPRRPEATVCPPSVVADTILRTIELGVMITDAAVDEKQTTIFCTSLAADPRCPDCGRDRALRGHRDPGVDGSRGTDVGSRAKLAPDEKRCAACCCVSAGE